MNNHRAPGGSPHDLDRLRTELHRAAAAQQESLRISMEILERLERLEREDRVQRRAAEPAPHGPRPGRWSGVSTAGTDHAQTAPPAAGGPATTPPVAAPAPAVSPGFPLPRPNNPVRPAQTVRPVRRAVSATGSPSPSPSSARRSPSSVWFSSPSRPSAADGWAPALQ